MSHQCQRQSHRPVLFSSCNWANKQLTLAVLIFPHLRLPTNGLVRAEGSVSISGSEGTWLSINSNVVLTTSGDIITLSGLCTSSSVWWPKLEDRMTALKICPPLAQICVLTQVLRGTKRVPFHSLTLSHHMVSSICCVISFTEKQHVLFHLSPNRSVHEWWMVDSKWKHFCEQIILRGHR